MKVWVLDELFVRTKLGLRVEEKFWCHLNDVYITLCMSICIIVYSLSYATMLMSPIALRNSYNNYNFICIFTTAVQHCLNHLVNCLNGKQCVTGHLAYRITDWGSLIFLL